MAQVNPGDSKAYPDAIEDNSFFIEESYNQEDRVVQHISNVYYRPGTPKAIMFSFTQEWPVVSYRHQFSYTIPFAFIGTNRVRGFGDILINYRYQLFYKNDWACLAPRFSVIIPTGNQSKGLGDDVVGFQLNLPASKRLSDFWVIHLNAGITVLPGVKNSISEEGLIKKTLVDYNFGGSMIWLVHPNLNFMLEIVENYASELNYSGKLVYVSETIINPGLRGAINLGDLQIVPGFSVPVFVSEKKSRPGFLFYLSFEHPF